MASGSEEESILAKRGESEEKSLCYVAFGVEIRTSEENLNKLVKEAIKKAICERALALRDEIKEEMNLEDTEKELQRLLEQLKISYGILMTIEEDIKRYSLNRQENFVILHTRLKTKETTLNCVRKCLEKVNEIEKRMNTLKLCWEYFRENYKDEIFKLLNQQIKIQKNEAQPELKWVDFLPDIGALKLNSSNLDTVL